MVFKGGEKIKERVLTLLKRLKICLGEDFLGNSIVCWLLFLNGVVNVAAWVIIAIFVKPVDFPVILHYNVYFGVDVTGQWWFIFSVPLLGLAIGLLNGLLAAYFYRKKERIASYLLLLSALMVQACVVVATSSLTIINY